jgi:RNA methyltransferase, TrmH family
MREAVSGIKHPAYRDALALTRAGGRAATGRYLVEDADTVAQALAADAATLYAVFATPEATPALEAACVARQVPLYVLGAGLLTKLLGTGYETSASAVAVVGQRIVPPEILLDAPAPLILCGERIQDPRNVGVLVRTAEAAGCAGLLLSDDSADPFSRQCVRSTTGSVLRLPVSLTPDLPAALADLRGRGATVVTASGEAARSAYAADLTTRPLVIVVGNEQDGVTDPAMAAADFDVSLPLAPGGADSLNVTVAAGALVYEAIRQAMAK